MGFSPVTMATAFALVLPVELPDKTLVATLVLSTRFRALPVFVGGCAAFAVQCVIAVAFGSALGLLPERAVAAVVALLFGLGAAVLLHHGFAGRRAAGEPAGAEPAAPASGGRSWRAALVAFGVLFAAEFGDASQLATAALTARSGSPLSVGLGAWLALVVIAGIGVLVGNRIGDRLPRRALLRLAGCVFAILAVLAAADAL